MDINSSPAGFAGPALPFGFNELADAIFLYRFKVFDHAHAILLPVSIVQLLQPFAREICTRVVVPVPHLFAGRDCTVYAAQPVGCITPTAPVLLTEKRHADRAVHATWGNQGCLKGIFHRHI